jgi:hypothetical protein
MFFIRVYPAINLFSALFLIRTVAQQRASTQKQLSYRAHLWKQWRHHNHLLISPIILVLFAIPRLMISFLSGCMKSPRNPELFLIGYFISFIPPLLTLVVYIVPSKTYRNRLILLFRQYRTGLCHRLSFS